MSWDIGFTIDTGAGKKHAIGPEYNMTYNVCEMYYDAFTPEFGGLKGLDGLQGSLASVNLDYAIKNFVEKADLYRSWNPPNGWGSYDRALELLTEMKAFCVDNPKVMVNVS